MAKQPGTSADLAKLLANARDQLTHDWNSFREPDGLILLRRAPPTRAPVKDTGPAITPSQLRKLKDGWITVEVENDFGLPWEGAIHLVLEDGSIRDVTTNDEGVVHLENIEPGTAGTSVQGLDAKTWDKK